MQSDSQEPQSSNEPTVLDWLKSLLKLKPIPIPNLEAAHLESEPGPSRGAVDEAVSEYAIPSDLSEREGRAIAAPLDVDGRERAASVWEDVAHPAPAEDLPPPSPAARIRLPAALVLALLAQRSLEAKAGGATMGIVLYLLAAGLAGWALWKEDFVLRGAPDVSTDGTVLSIRPIYFGLAVFFSAVCYLSARGNQFRTSTILSWVLGLLSMMLALWEGPLSLSTWRERFRALTKRPYVLMRIEPWHVLLLLAFAVSLYFRLTQLQEVPSEMVSDHAEKLLDIESILQGDHAIFFPRNTGREALQFYWSLAILRLLGTGTSFLTLKIGTALAGILTLPFIYLLGKEIGGRKAGLLAMLLAGIGYWPNIISRFGLRFPFYALFTAPALFFLVRGLRTKSRNDLLWMGVAVGMGLHGYTPARILPVVVSVGVIMYVLHRIRRGSAWTPISWLVGAGLIALVIFLPLLRVAVEMPDLFMTRILTRVGPAETPLPGSVLSVFLSNLWNALRMFGWDNGSIWVISIPGRPALDWVSAGLFHLGSAVVLAAYLRKRDWRLLFLLLSIPLLMLPSIMSLAFPAENPAPNRASGAMVPVFVLASLPLAALLDWGQGSWRAHARTLVAGAVVGVLVLLSMLTNYALVFDDYAERFDRSAWNTSEIGGVIRAYAESFGGYDTAHVMAYPYWVDNRLVGINAGVLTMDYSTRVDQLESLVAETRSQLFILNPADASALTRLRELFPSGRLSSRASQYPGHDFLVFLVPAKMDEMITTP